MTGTCRCCSFVRLFVDVIVVLVAIKSSHVTRVCVCLVVTRYPATRDWNLTFNVLCNLSNGRGVNSRVGGATVHDKPINLLSNLPLKLSVVYSTYFVIVELDWRPFTL